ncbi:MAG: DUF6599 family protein [Candidatus Zixiibacteriota bacterium]
MRLTIAIIIFGLFFLNACGDSPQVGGSKILPLNNLPPGWTEGDTVRTFVGEDLFLLINGGAEIYHEYGFERVYTQEFEFNSNPAVTAEVFKMKNNEAAFQIYSYKSGGRNQNIEIGDEGRLEQYYLNFRKGQYLITLTGYSGKPEIIEGIIELAKLIDARI